MKRYTEIAAHLWGWLTLVSILFLWPGVAGSVESICAKVKIEIRQEVTFERQAFDAHMQIDNGLTTLPLENINVDVLFTDETGEPIIASSNPDDPDASFFIRISSMDGVDEVSGGGTISPATTADIHWLIIPAPASVTDSPAGKIYFVGARLTYTIGGEEQETSVTPDTIKVKPLPLLTLDYFLPGEVYGDDPFTQEVEHSIPFSLGVRIANNGYGVAKDFKINSAQPKIVENELGLAVDFLIEASEVNGVIAPNTLLLPFGDIEGKSSAIGRWLMTSTLSGRFVEFDAEYSHADELGGELTSLLEEVNTHSLVQDVLVDVPGRDTIRDFLGKDNDVLRVFESDAGVSEVQNVSAGSKLSIVQNSGNKVDYALNAPAVAGFSYLQLIDPEHGTKLLSDVIRSDGKVISPENVWLSKKRVEDKWTYYFNLFDWNSVHSYSVKFIDPSLAPKPPVFETQDIPVEKEGEELTFLIQVTDPDNQEQPLQKMTFSRVQPDFLAAGSISSSGTSSPNSSNQNSITISVDKLPVGAEFIDLGNGTGILKWKPGYGQAGDYPLTFLASDGERETSIRYHMIITEEGSVPTAQFSASVFEGDAPLEVLFVDESTSKDGIESWLWNFGDGFSSEERNPFHIYEEGGQFSVSLTVTEIDGDQDTVTYENYIDVEDIEKLIPMEIGKVIVDQKDQFIPFDDIFVNPILVTTLFNLPNDESTVSARVTGVTAEGFSVSLENCEDEAGEIVPHSLSYVVMERGAYVLPNGKRIIASNSIVKSSKEIAFIDFPSFLDSEPIVMTSVNNGGDGYLAHAAIHNVDGNGFEVRLFSNADVNTESINVERNINYIAWEKSEGVVGSLVYEVGYEKISTYDLKQSVPFHQQFTDSPVIVTQMQHENKKELSSVQVYPPTSVEFEARIVADEYFSNKENKADRKRGENCGGNKKLGLFAFQYVKKRSDADGDSLSDLDELAVYKTNPNNADSDGDKISDANELEYWGDNYQADYDNDGLNNLLDFDSDNDGFGDGAEIHYGFDPADSSSHPVDLILESGNVVVSKNWQFVSLNREFVDPVVVAGINGAMNNDLPVTVRTGEISSKGFTIRLESSENDAEILNDEVSYIVVERGSYALQSGSRIEAGRFQLSNYYKRVKVEFADDMALKPIVLANVSNMEGEVLSGIYFKDISENGFLVEAEPFRQTENRFLLSIDYLAWQPSSGLNNQVLYEVGSLNLSKGTWESIEYTELFPQPPHVIAAVQKNNSRTDAAVQVRNVTSEGMDMRAISSWIHSDKKDPRNQHAGYVAIQTIGANDDTDNDGLSDLEELTIFKTHPGRFDTDGDGIGDGEEVTMWGAGWSDDIDNDGIANLLDYDSDGDGLADGIEQVYGYEPGDQSSRPYFPLYVSGAVILDNSKQTVRFNDKLIDPVVVASIVDSDDSAGSLVVNVSDVSQDGFSLKLQSANREYSQVTPHKVSYIAIERGSYMLGPNGPTVVAGTMTTRDDSSLSHQIFPEKMAAKPIVIANVISRNDLEPKICTLSDVNKSGFSTRLQSFAPVEDYQQSEYVDYVAWENVSGAYGADNFELIEIKNVGEQWEEIKFSNDYKFIPVIMAMPQRNRAKYPTTISIRNVTLQSVEIKVDNYSGKNNKKKKAKSTIGLLILGMNN